MRRIVALLALLGTLAYVAPDNRTGDDIRAELAAGDDGADITL